MPVIVAEDKQHQRDLQELFSLAGRRPKVILSPVPTETAMKVIA